MGAVPTRHARGTPRAPGVGGGCQAALSAEQTSGPPLTGAMPAGGMGGSRGHRRRTCDLPLHLRSRRQGSREPRNAARTLQGAATGPAPPRPRGKTPRGRDRGHDRPPRGKRHTRRHRCVSWSRVGPPGCRDRPAKPRAEPRQGPQTGTRHRPGVSTGHPRDGVASQPPLRGGRSKQGVEAPAADWGPGGEGAWAACHLSSGPPAAE